MAREEQEGGGGGKGCYSTRKQEVRRRTRVREAFHRRRSHFHNLSIFGGGVERYRSEFNCNPNFHISPSKIMCDVFKIWSRKIEKRHAYIPPHPSITK